MALQTVTIIKVGGIGISNFSRLEIIQTIHDHHSFSFQVRQDLLVEELRSVMPFSQQLYGEKISIEIKPIDGLEDLITGADRNDYIMQFYGIVTEVELQKSRIKDMEETIVIKGHSSTIVLENGSECNSFINMPLEAIVNKVKEGIDIDMDVRPFYKDNLPYTVQYNESSFSFLNRLAKRNGQWFYYNGRTTVFGTPGGVGGQPKLVYGVNMQDFNYTMKLIPAMFKTIENDNREGEYRKDETLNYRKETDGFQQNFLNKGNQVFNKETVIQLNQNPAGGRVRTVSEEYTKNKMRAVLSRLMEVTASSDVPGITIGNRVTISGVDMQLESSYRVIRIRHICDDGEGYENEFTAINFNDSVFSSETDPDLVPYCQSQTAVVTANADPDGLSAVKVQMPWQEAKGETTPYIPLMQQYGGNARGSHIIPEIGDTVFVDFQGNNAELPIVIGTMTSRKEKSGFSTPNNDLKVFRTRSGNKAIFNDETGDVTIESEKGQTFAVLYGDGNVKIKAPKNIEFEAGVDISLKAGKNIKIDADENIDIEAGNNIFIKAEGNIVEKGDEKIELIDEKITINSAEHIEMAEKININAINGDMILRASKTIHANSGENSNFN